MWDVRDKPVIDEGTETDTMKESGMYYCRNMGACLPSLQHLKQSVEKEGKTTFPFPLPDSSCWQRIRPTTFWPPHPTSDNQLDHLLSDSSSQWDARGAVTWPGDSGAGALSSEKLFSSVSAEQVEQAANPARESLRHTQAGAQLKEYYTSSGIHFQKKLKQLALTMNKIQHHCLRKMFLLQIKMKY